MKLLVAAYCVAVAWIANFAVAFIALGALLGAVSFVLWLNNRHNLRALDEFLADKARTGMAALDRQQARGHGA